MTSPSGPSIQQFAGELLAARNQLSEECLRMLKVVQQRCPGLLPTQPLPPGTPGTEIPLNPDEVQKLVTVAAATAAGAAEGADTVVWTAGGSELLVIVAKVFVRLGRGFVVVTIPVSCDQVQGAQIEVGFAVGDESRPAGLLAVTEDRPRGPAAVVDIWGDALTAYAWQVVCTVTGGVAGAAGEDQDGAPLIPVALSASPDGLRVLPMARHPFDRIPR